MPHFRAPTTGTRFAVWIFPALTLWLGLGYLFADPQRLSSPAFDSAKQVWSMTAWGCIFVTVALLKVGCLLLNRPRWYVISMCLGMGLYSWWAFLFAVSLFSDASTSPGAPAWPVFVVAAHAAVLSTLRAAGATNKER